MSRSTHCSYTREFGEIFISTASDHVLLITAGAQIMSELQDVKGITTVQQFRDSLEADLVSQMKQEGLNAASPPERAAYFRNWAINVFKKHPTRFLCYMMKSAVTLFVSDITGMFQLIGFTREAVGGYGILFRDGPQAALEKYFGHQWPLYVLASLPMILYDLIIYALVLIGATKLLRNRCYFLFCFFILTFCYWTAASSIASMPRYHFPMMPFMICLSASAVVGLFHRNAPITMGD